MKVYGKHLWMLIIVTSLITITSPAGRQTTSGDVATPRNIIFMIPDGMGLANVTIARTYLNGTDGAPLSFETLPYIGYQRTSSKDSYVTDSAAAASACASGEKFNNGEISCLDENGDGECDGARINHRTILELAREAGLAAGLVVTSDITHATPAAFGAHVHSRDCGYEIFKQLIENGIEVLLGGGISPNEGSCLLNDTGDYSDAELIARAQNQGYTYINDKNALAATGGGKLLGLFNDGGLTPVYKRASNSTEPTLAEMTTAALTILEKDPDGFFLMVEGSQIDWANHSRNQEYMIHEIIDFHNAVKVVREWMGRDGIRERNTLLVVAADHETGGVIIEGPYGDLPKKNDAASQKVRFASRRNNPFSRAEHTAVDTIVWSNSPELARAMDNTDLFYVAKRLLDQP